ncbi:MAG: hypothetical protein AB7E55_32785 [Pigmentiphaga sp.]
MSNPLAKYGLPNARFVSDEELAELERKSEINRKPYAIQRTEKRECKTVYWIGQGQEGETEFGIVLAGRDDFSAAHSILMAIDIGAKVILDFCNEKTPEEPQ